MELAHWQSFLHWYSWCVDLNILHPLCVWSCLVCLRVTLNAREARPNVGRTETCLLMLGDPALFRQWLPSFWRRHTIFVLFFVVNCPRMVGQGAKRSFPLWLSTGIWTGKLGTTHFLHPLGNQSKRDYNCKLSLKLFCVLEVMQANSEENSSPAERVSSCVFIVE